MSRARWTVLVALIAFVAALAGVIAGRLLTAPAHHDGGELHALLHDELTLTTAQRAAIDTLETRFAAQRGALEARMRADNVQLAAAMAAEHAAGPRVTAAVDACHHTMGTLQKATLTHVFAMRALLRSDQTPAFDRAVARALTADHR